MIQFHIDDIENCSLTTRVMYWLQPTTRLITPRQRLRCLKPFKQTNCATQEFSTNSNCNLGLHINMNCHQDLKLITSSYTHAENWWIQKSCWAKINQFLIYTQLWLQGGHGRWETVERTSQQGCWGSQCLLNKHKIAHQHKQDINGKHDNGKHTMECTKRHYF